MRHLLQLVKTGLFTPASVVRLWRAKKKHRKNICFILKFAADQYGDAVAISDGQQSYTFRELYHHVLRLSHIIHNAIHPQSPSTVVLRCDNSPAHVLAFYALQNLGLQVVLVNSKIHKSELAKIIHRQQQPCCFFTSDPEPTPAIPCFNLDNLVEQAKIQTVAERFSPHAAKLLFATSGTTGEAKLVEKRSGEMYWLRSFADLLDKTSIHKRRAVYITVPISHGFGYTAVLFALVLGKKAVISQARTQPEITTLLQQQQPDLLVGVPSYLNQLARLLNGTPHPIRSVISGGAAMNDTMLANIRASFGNQLFSIYGSTEASVSFIADIEHLERFSHALGIPFAGIGYRLEPLVNGGCELLVRSKLSNLSGDWIRTGDLAEKLDDGTLTWLGRKDNMIIKNGVNIYPEEIENLLQSHPAIEDAMVTGQADEEKGQSILATIQYREGHQPGTEELVQYLRQYLSGIKIPDRFSFTNGFVYTSTGKKIKPPPTKGRN